MIIIYKKYVLKDLQYVRLQRADFSKTLFLADHITKFLMVSTLQFWQLIQ